MKNKKAFTLIELLTVLLFVAILTTVALPQYRRVIDKARVTEAQAMLRALYDSSERLAGEFGFRSYERLMAVRGVGHEADYAFPRLDMIDVADLPTGCSLADPTVLECARFKFKLLDNGYVVAHKLGNPYDGTRILLKRDTLDLYCQPSASDTNAVACDVYGLDVVRNAVTF